MKTWCLLPVLVAATLAQAQMADPTRPPDAASVVTGVASAPAANMGVQAVFLRQGAKPAALINSEYVVQGGRLGDKRVLKITEVEVVLRDATGQKETLKVVAGVEKTPAIGKATAKKPGRSDANDGDKGK